MQGKNRRNSEPYEEIAALAIPPLDKFGGYYRATPMLAPSERSQRVKWPYLRGLEEEARTGAAPHAPGTAKTIDFSAELYKWKIKRNSVNDK